MIVIKVGGKERHVAFNTNSMDIWCRLQSASLKDYLAIFTTDKVMKGEYAPGEIRDVVYSGLAEGHRKRYGTKNTDFSVEDVGEWLTDITEKDMKLVYEAIYESILPPDKLKLFKKELKAATKKKKSKSKTSATSASSSSESTPDKPESTP